MRTNKINGWTRILDKVDSLIKDILCSSSFTNIDLIGHSSGGLLSRAYLTNDLFNGKSYDGKSITTNLVTLGSPHQAKRATPIRMYIDKKYPGNFYKNVIYTSVGGTLDLNSNNARLFTKLTAKNSYKSITGQKDETGDGLVPLSSSLLKGSRHIVLENTAHGGFFGKEWYGSTSRIKYWYEKINW